MNLAYIVSLEQNSVCGIIHIGYGYKSCVAEIQCGPRGQVQEAQPKKQQHFWHIMKNSVIWGRFLSLTRSKLRLCSANNRAGYCSILACDWLSIVWAYSEQETETDPAICRTRPQWCEIRIRLFPETLLTERLWSYSRVTLPSRCH